MPDIFSATDTSNVNKFLVGLPEAEWDRLRPCLRTTMLASGTILHDTHSIIDQVYFLQSGYVSVMTEFDDGFQAETGQIGADGMVGIALVLGGRVETTTAVVRIDAVALRASASVFLAELEHMPVLKRQLLSYANALRVRAMQLAGCNAHHGLSARLARQLLEMQDRCLASDVPITHQTLSMLLCAHRPSVSVTIKRLEHAGLIRCGNSSITIVNRRALEQASCRCYHG